MLAVNLWTLHVESVSWHSRFDGSSLSAFNRVRISAMRVAGNMPRTDLQIKDYQTTFAGASVPFLCNVTLYICNMKCFMISLPIVKEGIQQRVYCSTRTPAGQVRYKHLKIRSIDTRIPLSFTNPKVQYIIVAVYLCAISDFCILRLAHRPCIHGRTAWPQSSHLKSAEKLPLLKMIELIAHRTHRSWTQAYLWIESLLLLNWTYALATAIEQPMLVSTILACMHTLSMDFIREGGHPQYCPQSKNWYDFCITTSLCTFIYLIPSSHKWSVPRTDKPTQPCLMWINISWVDWHTPHNGYWARTKRTAHADGEDLHAPCLPSTDGWFVGGCTSQFEVKRGRQTKLLMLHCH